MENTNSAPASFVPQFGYGGFWRRWVANMLDNLIIGIICSPFTYQAVTSTLDKTSSASSTSAWPFFLSIAYVLFFWVKQNGQTLGKRIMGLRVVKEDGQPLDLSTAVIRYLGYLISSILLLGYISAAFDKKKQGWHDKIANTIVIKTDDKKRTGLMVLFLSFYIISFLLIFSLIVIFAVFGFRYARNKSATDIRTNLPSSVNSSFSIDEEVFDLVNQKRRAKDLQPIILDTSLCAYGQRRLIQIDKAGKYDNGQGFYKDLSDGEVLRTYFSTKESAAEQFYSNTNGLFAPQIVASWENSTSPTPVTDTTKIYGCARSDDKNLVFITASAAK